VVRDRAGRPHRAMDRGIINEIRNEMIAWRTTTESQLTSAESVHFDGRSDGRGTVVRVKLQYGAPAGALGGGGRVGIR
jgi:uncharacterized membrane protein